MNMNFGVNFNFEVSLIEGLPEDLKALMQKHRANAGVMISENGWLSFVITLWNIPGVNWVSVVHNGGFGDALVMFFDKRAEVIERRKLPFREALVQACEGLAVMA